MLKLFPGRVRIPDTCFIAWEQLPGHVFPREPIPKLHPDLAIEVLSESNTKAEMHSKLHDYFNSGARLVWYLDPDTQIMEVFTTPVKRIEVGIDGVLDGGDVLPGLQLPMAAIFRVPRAAE
jgi:Uma2 family endonuclease